MFFFPDKSGTPIPVSTIVKDLGVQTDNMFSPSAQCTAAANKARRLIFMIRRSFQDLSKSAFMPLYGALVRPHLEYGMPACSPNLVADINHLKIFKGLLDIDPNLFFLLPARSGLRGHPFKGLQSASRLRRRGSAFSVRIVKYWNKLPASVVTAPFFKRSLTSLNSEFSFS